MEAIQVSINRWKMEKKNRGNIIQLLKKEYFIICENMDEPWGECAKQIKSDIERWIYAHIILEA